MRRWATPIVAGTVLVVGLAALLGSGGPYPQVGIGTGVSPTGGQIIGPRSDAAGSGAILGLLPVYTGLGGGGHAFGYSIHPTSKDRMFIGTDVSGAFITLNAGASYTNITPHLNTDMYDGFNYYVAQSVGVQNSSLSGFVMATHGGIYQYDTRVDTAFIMTDPDSGYWYGHWEFGSTFWNRVIPFSAIAWDGDDYLVAGAGRCRLNREGSLDWEKGNYPDSVETDSVGYDYDSGNVNSVRRYYFDDAAPAWKPLAAIGNIGAVRDIDVEIVSTDTLVAVASGQGVFLWTSAYPDSVIDLSGRDLKHETYTYNWTFDEDNHNAWSVDLTARGSLYVGIAMSAAGAATTDGKAGVYRIHDATDPADFFWWVGDETAISWTQSGASLWDGSLGNEDGTDDDSGDEAQHDEELCKVTVKEGSGSSADTVYAGDTNGRASLMKTTVAYADSAGGEAAWDSLVWWDTNIGMRVKGSEGGLNGLDGYFRFSDYAGQWPTDFIGWPQVSGTRVVGSFNDRLLLSNDGGATWANISSTRMGASGADSHFFKGRGWDELNTPLNGVVFLRTGER